MFKKIDNVEGSATVKNRRKAVTEAAHAVEKKFHKYLRSVGYAHNFEGKFYEGEH